MNAYLNMWKHILDFSGKTTRRHFSSALVQYVVYGFLVAIVEAIVFARLFGAENYQPIVYSPYGIYCMLGCIALTSMSVRRLRDAGYGPKTFFLLLIPGLGLIAFAVRLWGKSMGTEKKETESGI